MGGPWSSVDKTIRNVSIALSFRNLLLGERRDWEQYEELKLKFEG